MVAADAPVLQAFVESRHRSGRAADLVQVRRRKAVSGFMESSA
jgi:hypothetical protein